ncbi:MAG: ABC transporter ATP-binding protein [Syntrophomonadaceae bacterium]|nr:ABC transporter ATP-binding protein [Syntrophomonadaceae bacterium]
MAQIKLNSISKTLDGLFTLNKVSIQAKQGETVVILGPSGCGKSTLLNITAGLIPPDEGQVIIDGQDWSNRTGRVSYMQQKDLLLPSRTILDNVSIPLILKGMNTNKSRKLAGQHMGEFGLLGFENYYPRQLSGGMKQRAALLRTYLFASDILLLDEPFASLDAITSRKMQLWLKDFGRKHGCTIVFVTHDIEEALLLANRIYVLSARPARIIKEIILHEPTSPMNATVKEEILSILDTETGDDFFK